MRAAALVLLGFALGGVLPAHAAAPVARLQVVADEFHYRLSRLRVPPGPVRIEVVNFGEDEHNLRLRRIGGSATYELPAMLPGERGVLALRLPKGRYRLWCSLADHTARGMRAELTVRPRPRPRPVARSGASAAAFRGER